MLASSCSTCSVSWLSAFLCPMRVSSLAFSWESRRAIISSTAFLISRTRSSCSYVLYSIYTIRFEIYILLTIVNQLWTITAIIGFWVKVLLQCCGGGAALFWLESAPAPFIEKLTKLVYNWNYITIFPTTSSIVSCFKYQKLLQLYWYFPNEEH